MREFTFDVSPQVKLGEPLPSEKEVPDYFVEALPGPVEAVWKPPRPLAFYCDSHSFLEAVSLAFYSHYPLRISPDIFWITLARGFAQHINLHAETFRERFVAHQGKKELWVNRPDFLPGRDNPWEEVFAEFSDQIATQVGKMRDFVICNFSTTGPLERAVSELLVMDTFQSYFAYGAAAGCGIPRITVTGTVDDWKSIRSRAALFGEFGLESWSRALDPILLELINTVSRKPNHEFWRSFFRFDSMSGISLMTGWISALFPYIKDQNNCLTSSPHLETWEERLRAQEAKGANDRWNNPQGLNVNSVPPCMIAVPLKIRWGAIERQARLLGGLMAISQNSATLAVQPECGWAIVYESSNQ